jgi:peroxiredoxin
MTETIAPGTDADPPTAKLSPMAVGDTLPSLVLKNEKDEDVDVKSLTEEKGLVLFLVPKADTRTSFTLSLLHFLKLKLCTLLKLIDYVSCM